MALASRKLRQYELDPEELERRLEASFTVSAEELEESIAGSITDVHPGNIVQAKVDSVDELSLIHI